MEMRIAIVEDDRVTREALRDFSRRWCRERALEAEVRLYESGEAFLSDDREAELVLMDIEMAGMTGLDAARRLRERGGRAQLIFVTYLVQYAIEGYSVDAVDFIAKPVTYPALCAGADRALRRMVSEAPRFLTTSYAREPVNVQVQQIAYVESLNKRTLIRLLDGREVRSSEPLYALEEKLSGEAFFRCHNAFLVNLRHVKTVSAAALTVQNHTLPISKYRKKAFFDRLASYRAGIL